MLSFCRGIFKKKNSIKSYPPSSKIRREKLIFPRQIKVKRYFSNASISLSLVKPSCWYPLSLVKLYKPYTISAYFTPRFQNFKPSNPIYSPIKLIKQTSTQRSGQRIDPSTTLSPPLPPISINQPAKWLFFRSKSRTIGPIDRLSLSLSLQFLSPLLPFVPPPRTDLNYTVLFTKRSILRLTTRLIARNTRPLIAAIYSSCRPIQIQARRNAV